MLVALAAPATAVAQGGADPLSFRAGRAVEVDVDASLRVDARDVGVSPESAPDLLDVSRARLGLDVRLWRRLDLQVERDFRDAPQPWRDVFANLEIARALEVRAGRFKAPFSTERLNSGLAIDFVYRSLAASQIAPVRDTGVMVHGEVLRRRVGYQVGVFRAGGEEDDEPVPTAESRVTRRSGALVTGRAVLTPWARARRRALRDLNFAAAVARGTVPEGRNSLDVRAVFGDRLFPHLEVNGRRTRVAGSADWRHGPFGAAGEWIRSTDERLGQGTDDDDLPPVVASGWHAQATWMVTGEDKDDRVAPDRPLLRGGAGAIEAAVRFEEIRMGGPDTGEPRSRSPRARSVIEPSQRVWTLGVNWYPVRWVKVQANVIREDRNADAAALTGRARVWSRVVRAQVGL